MSFGNEIKDFVKAFTAAQANQSKNRYYDYMEQQARLRTKLLEKKQQEADAPMNAYREGAKNAQGIGGFNEAVDRTIGFEGRSVGKDNNGAKVKFGINQAFNKDIDVANLTEDQARDIYKTRYWDPINGDELARNNPALAHVAFDAAVNAGVPKAREFISGANGDPYKLLQLRQAHQDSLVANDNPDDPKYRPYAKGWASRNDALRSDLDAYTGTGGGTTAAIPMPPRRPSEPQAALPLPVSEQPAQYASLDDPNQEYLYEQPEYAASGGMIGQPRFRLPSLSANGMNIGGGIGSNFRSQLPNLGRTMQAIPGISSPMGGGYTGGSLQDLRASQAQQYNALRASNPGLPDISGMAQNYTQNGALPNVSSVAPQGLQNYFNPAKLQQWLPHFARGGFVDYGSNDSDDSDSGGDDSFGENEMQQASAALDTIGGGDSGDDEDTPFSSVRPAVYDALHHIQNTFGLTPGAVQTNSQGFQAFASGAGRASPELKRDVDKAVDPHDKMDDALRNMAGLDALYKFYRDRGEIGKAQAAVSSLILAAQDTASRFGGAALRAPDAKSAGKLVTEGINKTIPGVKAELDENGNYTFTDPVTGEVKETGQLSPQKLLAAAMGLKDGTMYWKTLSDFANPQRAQSAAMQKLAAEKAASERLQGVVTRALDPNADETPATGTPATGEPTIPSTPASTGTPAAVGAPAAPTLPPEQQPSAIVDPASVVPKLPVIPGGKLTGPAAAVLLKRPANIIETMTPDERRDFLGMKGSVQKNLQATYENGLKTQAQAKLSGMYQPPKELTAAERDHVVTHVGKAVDDIDENVVKPANKKLGKDEGMSPTDKAQVTSVAQEIAAGNPGMFGNKAAEIAFKSVVLPPDMPTIPVDANGKVDISKVPSGLLPFKFIPATQQHPAMLQTRDGKTANVTPNVRETIIPVLQHSLQQIADKQQVKIKADAEKARIKAQSDRGVASGTAAAGRYLAEPGTPEPAPGSLYAPFQRTVPLGSTAVAAARAARFRAPQALPDAPPPPPGVPLNVWELNQRR